LNFLYTGISLLFSFFIVILTKNSENVQIVDTDNIKDLQKKILNFVSSFSFISNAAVCSLFSGVEIQALFSTFRTFLNKNSDKNENENKNQIKNINTNNKDIDSNNALTNTIPLIISLIIAAISFLTPAGGPAWPLQNILNICIAITVGRAVQLPRLPYIILALTGLVFYDVFSVVGTQQFTDGIYT
jgi:hypothetical protein